MFIIRKTILHAIAPFAMVANKINWRIGRPYKSQFATLQPHIEKLAPGMIILSHKDFELTNWFINGYWTHVAVIASDNHVIEAVSKGVVKTNICKFFSAVDDFIILEPSFCSRSSMLEAVEYMEQYIGYPYNFKFIPSDQSFTCIDLVGRAYSLSDNIGKVKSASSPGLINYLTREVILPENIMNIEDGWKIVHRLIA